MFILFRDFHLMPMQYEAMPPSERRIAKVFIQRIIEDAAHESSN